MCSAWMSDAGILTVLGIEVLSVGEASATAAHSAEAHKRRSLLRYPLF
jgi:hypothetical protein